MVGPLSRYRDLAVIEIDHPARGRTRSLAVRRPPRPAAVPTRPHVYGAADTEDLLALRYFGREELYWHLRDANGGRPIDELAPGEVLAVPSPERATRVARPTYQP
jgi:hypothetical protein